MQTPDQVRFCKILGHNSKKIIRICISQQNCPIRYLCEQCLKTTPTKLLDQCITLEQLKVKVREAKMSYSQTSSTQEIIQQLMNKINQCKQMISQQFNALEQKIMAFQMNIKNSQQNALQALDSLDSNPFGFNDNTLMSNLSYLNFKEYQMNLQKGQHFLKQSFNTLHEQTLQFKLIGPGHSQNNSQTSIGISVNSWQIKGIDNYLLSMPTKESHKFILFYSQKTQELMYQIQFILYMKKAPNNRAGRKVLGQLEQWDNHIQKQEDNINLE